MYFEVFFDEDNGELHIENELVATDIDDPEVIGFYVSEWIKSYYEQAEQEDEYNDYYAENWNEYMDHYRE